MKQAKIDAIKDKVAEYNPEALLMDGFEDAIIGIAERCGQPALVVYDREKCLKVLMKRDGMSYEGATEFFDFNCSGAWMGEHTPIILTKISPE